MKRIIALFILIFSTSILPGQDEKYNSLIITNSNKFQPYSFISERGKPDGLLIDLWRLWAKKNNVKITFKLVPWNESLKLIEAGEADVHAGLISSKKRSEDMDFGKLDVPLETAIFISEKMTINTIEEIHKTPIVTLKGDYVNEFIEEHYPYLTLKKYAFQDDIIRDLKYNKIPAFAYNVPQISYTLYKYKLLGKYRLLKKLYTIPFSYGVRKGDTDLIDFIDSGMAEITEEEKDNLYKNWLYFDLFPITFKDIIKWISFASIIILFTFLFINYFLLKAQVNNKTKELQNLVYEKEKLIKNLQDALSKIKMLKGLLPICASCKKIRNDDGYWEDVDVYIQEHSDADFSHGICPECSDKLYSDQEWYKKKENK